MRVLVTGGNGFLGKHIVLNLANNHDVSTLSRSSADIECDLRKEVPMLNSSFELIVHCSGKVHSVPKTEEQEKDFFDTNVFGTQNLLTALENAVILPKSFIFISSVAVYGKYTGNLIKENSSLDAKDPYGRSKILAEKLLIDWCDKNGVVCTVLRLPLIAGLNPPGNLGEMIKGIKRGYYLNVSGGNAKKSIVLAADVASIIPPSAKVGGIYNLTDRSHPSFYELSELIANQLGKSKPFNIPQWIAVLIAKVGDLLGSRAPINSDKLKKITNDLTFDDQKAVKEFGWDPKPVLKSIIIA